MFPEHQNGKHMNTAGINTPNRIKQMSAMAFKTGSRFLLLASLVLPPAVQAVEPMPSQAKVLTARNKIAKRMVAHEEEHKGIVQAYAKLDAALLEKTALRMARNPGLPGGDDLMADEFSPFLKCDTAHRDLALLASAMAQHAARGAANLKRIVDQEQADYDRSHSTCVRRLAMPPTAAWADYQAE